MSLLVSVACLGSGAVPPATLAASIATSQSSSSVPGDPQTMTAGAGNLRETSIPATGTANALASATTAAIATATAGPSLAEANAPDGWNLILYEPFADNGNKWPEGADDSSPLVHVDHQVIGSQYLVTANAGQGFSSYSYPQMPNVLDFYVTVDGRLISGAPTSEYGLIANLDPQTGDYYAFLINEQGLWAFSLHKAGEWFPIKNGRSSLIAAGGNHLAVLCVQNDYTFYVNHQPIARAHDDRLSAPGKTGVFVEDSYSGEASIAFDNFTVLTP